MRPKIFAVDIDGTITENHGGQVSLDALEALRYMERLGHKVIFVSGRSSIEGYVLSVFAGTTRIAVGENGGAVTFGPSDHKLLGNKDECVKAFEFLKLKIPQMPEDIQKKSKGQKIQTPGGGYYEFTPREQTPGEIEKKNIKKKKIVSKIMRLLEQRPKLTDELSNAIDKEIENSEFLREEILLAALEELYQHFGGFATKELEPMRDELERLIAKNLAAQIENGLNIYELLPKIAKEYKQEKGIIIDGKKVEEYIKKILEGKEI
ncbi:MAG: HAD hydrolase family protein [Parcubacteria group bacterium]|nr:HAD hydrolase family protein [Parcubacteria group bacterium]